MGVGVGGVCGEHAGSPHTECRRGGPTTDSPRKSHLGFPVPSWPFAIFANLEKLIMLIPPTVCDDYADRAERTACSTAHAAYIKSANV